MKSNCLVILTISMLCSVVTAQETTAPQTPKPKTLTQKASYAIGLNIGESMKADGLELDLDLFAKGITDALAGVKPLLTEAEIQEAMTAFQRDLADKQAARAKMLGETNLKEGQAFLAANAKKPGVVTMASGLQYLVLKKGMGAIPKPTDTVTAHYHGTLIDGSVFDSSVERGQPFMTQVGGVIKGWTEALLKMKVGDKWRLFLPSELAYGDRGAGADIGPNAVLIFEIELLGIQQ